MKNCIVCLIILFVWCNSLRAQWQQVPVDSVPETINFLSVSFVTDKVGYIAGCDQQSAWSESVLLKTTDGGVTWKKLAHPIGNCLSPIFFVNENIGYNGGQSFMKTIDGGKTWFTPDNSIPGTLTTNCIYFLNDSVGFLDGGPSLILKTTDGGKSFVQIPIPVKGSVSAFFFTTPQTGFATGYDSPFLLKTTNAGSSWDTVSNRYALTDLFFPSASIGYATGANGIILKTFDGGQSWLNSRQQNMGSATLRSIYCVDNNICFIAGDSGILKTTDGGLNWEKDSAIEANTFNAITCTKKGNCYVLGNNKTLLRTKALSTQVHQPVNKKKDELLIYPNPSLGPVTIEYCSKNTGADAYVLIFDAHGKVVGHYVLVLSDNVYKTQCDFSSLCQGVFFCQLFYNGRKIKSQSFQLVR